MESIYGVINLGRREQRALMQSKQRVIIPTYATKTRVITIDGEAVWFLDGRPTGEPHKDGNRTIRRAAIKANRTAQRQASREFQGLSPAEIVIVKRRKAEQSARKAAMRARVKA